MHAQVQAERRERRAAIWQRGEEAAAEARLWQEEGELRMQLLALQLETLSRQLSSSSWGMSQDDRACHLARVRRLIAADGAVEMIAHAAH